MPTPDINTRLCAAVLSFNAMDPVDRALMISDQRRSYVRGMSDREPPRDVLADEVRRLRVRIAELEQESYTRLVGWNEANKKIRQLKGVK